MDAAVIGGGLENSRKRYRDSRRSADIRWERGFR